MKKRFRLSYFVSQRIFSIIRMPIYFETRFCQQAYRHPKSASVQIAKIAAATIILSSLLLGSFILAASYVQARAGCHQLDQLDAMLEKELALEARQMQADAYMQVPCPNFHYAIIHR